MNKYIRERFFMFLVSLGYSINTPSGNQSTVGDYIGRVERELGGWSTDPNVIQAAIDSASDSNDKSALKLYLKFIELAKNL